MSVIYKLFPRTFDKIWADGYAVSELYKQRDMKRLAVQIRDLNNGNWDFPKGTRREEAAALMIEQSAQIVEAFK